MSNTSMSVDELPKREEWDESTEYVTIEWDNNKPSHADIKDDDPLALRKHIIVTLREYYGPPYTNCVDDILSLIEQYALNKQVEVVNRFEQSINQHTTPEGSDLLTRSYVRNTIDFERHRITELEKQLETKASQEDK